MVQFAMGHCKLIRQLNQSISIEIFSTGFSYQNLKKKITNFSFVYNLKFLIGCNFYIFDRLRFQDFRQTFHDRRGPGWDAKHHCQSFKTNRLQPELCTSMFFVGFTFFSFQDPKGGYFAQYSECLKSEHLVWETEQKMVRFSARSDFRRLGHSA